MTGRDNSEAITAVIEKLTEIVGSNESTQDGFFGEPEDSCDGITEVEIEVSSHATLKSASEALAKVQNLNRTERKAGDVRIVPCGRSSQKEKTGSQQQMVLNFPIKLANFDIASPQNLLETLQILNRKLSVEKKLSIEKTKEVQMPPDSQQDLEKVQDGEDTDDDETKTVFKCSKCNYSSHNKHYLKQHTGLVHNAERLYKCPFCDYAGKRSYSLKEHLIVHSTYRPYECSYCNASFRKKGHLTNHVKMHSSQKTLACVLCHVTVQSRVQLYEHLRREHDADSVYACDACEYATAIKSNIVMHMHTHGDPKLYKCRGCQFTAPHVNIIRQHLMAVHRDNGTAYTMETAPHKPGPVILMKCSECGYTCVDKDELKDHILQRHIDVSDLMVGSGDETGGAARDQAGRYKCVQCNFTSSDAYPFITHILSHKPKVPLTQALQEEGDHPKSSSPLDDTPSARPALPGAAPRQHFTHDATNGMYRCAICNYTCEYQRTIKAHIWKHSGHKDIDYPMFQNGPLSVYDDTPVGMSILLSSKAPVSHVVSSAVSSKAPVSYVVSSAVSSSVMSSSLTHENRSSKRIANVTTARLINIAPRKHLVAKSGTETAESTASKLPTQQPGERVCVDKHTADPHVQRAFGRISGNGPVVVIMSAAERKKQQEATASALTDISLKEKVTLSAPEGSNDSAVCSGANQLARPAGHKVVQDPALKTIQRPPLTTTVHIVQSPATAVASTHKTVTTITTSDSNAKRTGEVTSGNTLLTIVTDALTTTGSKRKFSNDDSLSVSEEVPAKKHLTEVACLAQHPGLSCVIGEKSDVAKRIVSKSVHVRKLSDVVKVLASPGGARKEVKPVPTTLRLCAVRHNLEIPENVIAECLRRNSDKENEAEPKTKEKTSSGNDTQPSGSNDALGGALCSNISCDNVEDILIDDDGSKPNAGICQSLLAVIEQLRSRSESECDDKGADGSTGGTNRKRKLDDEWVPGSNEQVEVNDGQYRCRLCHYKSASAAVVAMHMRMHKEKPPSECSLCDFQADTSESLQDHMLQHCKLRTYQCRLCSCTFNYKSQLRSHMRAHMGTAVHVCGTHMDAKSGETRQSEVDLTGNQDSDQVLDCEQSGTDADPKPSQQQQQQQLGCDVCGFVATSHVRLTEHHHQQHGGDERELECELCEFVATSVRSLKSHMKRHVNDQRFVLQPLEQYKCNMCGYVCHHLPSLKSHMWRHAGDTNYSYESTNNIINAAIDFDTQRCVRRSPKEYRCNMCGYTCYHLPSLKSHMWRHSSDQNYHYKFMADDFLHSVSVSERGPKDAELPLVTFRCCQCGFESTDKGRLRDHMVVHAGDGHKTPGVMDASAYEGDAELVAPECVEEVTVTTCVQ